MYIYIYIHKYIYIYTYELIWLIYKHLYRCDHHQSNSSACLGRQLLSQGSILLRLTADGFPRCGPCRPIEKGKDFGGNILMGYNGIYLDIMGYNGDLSGT